MLWGLGTAEVGAAWADRALPAVTAVEANAAERNWISTWPVSYFWVFFVIWGFGGLVFFYLFS